MQEFFQGSVEESMRACLQKAQNVETWLSDVCSEQQAVLKAMETVGLRPPSRGEIDGMIECLDMLEAPLERIVLGVRQL